MLNFDNINLIAEQEYYPFSEKEIINITNHIKELEYKDSLNTEIINKYKQLISQYQTQEQLDTLLIYYKDKKIILMEERIEQLEKDSWIEKYDQYIYYFSGVLTIVLSSLIVKKVNE